MRMDELGGSAVQGLPLDERVGGFVFAPVQVSGVAHGVEAVADDGVAQGAEVDAQLVGAAGLGLETEQGVLVGEGLDGFVGGYGRFPPSHHPVTINTG
jgi:hypothetical protein